MKEDFIEYVMILETHNEGDRAIIESILSSEGIDYLVQGRHVAPYIYHALPMRIMVRKEQAEQAREVLKGLKLSFTYSGPGSYED
jgi:hypothetical protein